VVNPEKLTSFGRSEESVSFVKTNLVTQGVECDVYSFSGDQSRDLAVVRVAPGAKTPLQKVLSGVTTTEGYVAGKGTLTVQSPDGQVTSFDFDERNQGEGILIEVGQVMQWSAAPDVELVFYEVCVPPYEDGRYENLPE